MQNNIINRVLGVSGKSNAKRMLGHSNNAIKVLGHTNNFTHKIGHSNSHVSKAHSMAEKYVSPLANDLGDATN
jgi:hypothetical protein